MGTHPEFCHICDHLLAPPCIILRVKSMGVVRPICINCAWVKNLITLRQLREYEAVEAGTWTPGMDLPT